MKTSNPSIVKNKKPKEETKPRHIPDAYTWNLVPVMDNAPDVWAQELRQWIRDNPQARTLTEFMDSKEIYRKTFYQIVERFPVLKAAHEGVMMTLGERLWQDSMNKKTEWKSTHHRLYRYGKEFEEDDAYHAKLSRERNDATVAALVSGIMHSNKDKIHESNT